MALDTRVTIYAANMGSVLCLDAYGAGDLYGGTVEYEDTPTGCGSGKLSLGIRYEEMINRGYYRGMNIVEISTGDLTLATSAAAGANKYYLAEGTWALDPAQGEDGQQLYFYDGATLTMRVPVTGIGSDGGGAYVTTSAPLGGGSVPAYTAGTIVGRRRYTGRINRRTITVQREPGGIDIELVGLSVAFTQAVGSFNISIAAAVDVGPAIYNSIEQFASTHWPFFAPFTIAQFPTTGSTYHGTLTDVGCDRLISDAVGAITSADQWFVRVGHDRLPRLVKLFSEATDTYTYNVALAQGALEDEPLSISITDEDSSNIFNSVLITGDTDPTTNQPVTAIVQDPTAAAIYGFQIDGAPISNVGIKDVTGAASYGLGQVDEFALPVATTDAVIYTTNDSVAGTTPGNLKRGDVVRASACLTTRGYDQSGLVSNWSVDSGIAYGVSTTSLWTTAGAATAVDQGGSPDGFNAWSIPCSTGGAAQSVATPCVPGQQWTFTGYINATGASGGSGNYQWVLINAATSATIASVSRSSGSGTPAPVTATIPAGCTSIVLKAFVGSGGSGSVLFAQPNLCLGPTLFPYVPNLAAPNVLGLPTSVVTTIDFDKQLSQQKVSFAAIEPSFQAEIAQGLNAISTQLRANVAALNSIDSYCVSSNARNYTTSSTSLVVSFPAFLAQFAPQTTLVSIPATNVTLTASTTNWVWLQSSGTFIVQTSATPVQGAILMAIFQTSATGWLGDSGLKASVGVFQIGVGNVNAASNLPTPTFSGVTVTNGNSLNGLAADIVATLTLTNVPTNGNASQAQFYFRLTGGSGTWIPYEGQNLTVASGSLYPTASQTQTFEYGDMTNGTTYDLGVGYVGFAGYGPVAVFQSAFVAKTIAITAPYMYGGSTPTPTFAAGATATNGYSANGVSADVILQFTANNQPTDASLSRVQLWVRVSATGGSNTIGASTFNWSPYGGQPAVGVGSSSPPSSGAYVFSLADLTNGQTYDFGLTYENNQGGESIVGVIISNFAAAALNLPTTGNATMPSAIATNGPNITAAAVGTIVASGSGSDGVPFTFSIGDWATNAQPGWFAGFVFYWRQHGTTAQHSAGVLGVTGTVSGLSSSIMVPAAISIDIGIAYEGAQSVQSAINWTSYLSNIAVPVISPPASIAGTDQANLVPDGQLAHVLSSSNEAYWFEYLIDGTSFYALANGDSTTYGLFAWKSGSNGSSRYANSQPFNLVAGTAYTMSAYIDLIGATGTGGVRVIGPISTTISNTNPANAATAVASILKAGGSSGKFSATFTPSTSGKYVFQCSNSGITIGGSPIFMGQFQVEQGSSFTGFKPNTPVQTDSTTTNAGTTAHTAASVPVQTTITPTAGAEGSFLASAAVARRHIAGNTTFNFVFNPTAAANTQGWSTYDSTAHATFSRDGLWGGRFIITVPSGTLSGYDALWEQTIAVNASTAYTISGNYYCNSIPSGGYALVDVYSSGGTLLGQTAQLTAASATLFPFSFTIATGSYTSVTLRLRVYTGGTSPTTSTSAAFNALKFEYGSVSTTYSDDYSTALVTTTHQQTPGADGSFLLPAVVAGRHLVGAPSTDTGAIADSGGLILYTRHAQQVQQTLNATFSCGGQMPYCSGTTVYFPSGLLVFRTNGQYCRLATGFNYSFAAAPTQYGAFYITWVANGTASAFGFVDYTNPSYQAVVTNPAYQVVGFSTNDAGTPYFMANWVHAQHLSGIQSTIDANGHTIGSALLYNQFSINAFTDCVISVSTSTNSSNSCTITSSWPASHVRRADGSTYTIGAGSCTVTGYGSTTYYMYFWFSPTQNPSYSNVAVSGGYMMYSYPTSQQSIATSGYLQAMQLDGAMAVATGGLASFTTPAAPASGNSNGVGGGKPPACPAAWQEVETYERGFVRADELKVGEHLRDSEHGWNEIRWLQLKRDTIVDVTAGDQTFSVEINHLWLRATGNPDGRSADWIPTKDLSLDTLVSGRLEDHEIVVPINGIRSRGKGDYVRVVCDRNRFMLGRTVAHNFETV